MARVHFVVRPPRGGTVRDVDQGELERTLVEATRSWEDDFTQAVVSEYGEETGARLSRDYVDSFPEAYKEDFAARTGAVDLGRLEGITRSEEHTSELQSLMRISYAVFCLKNKHT